MGKKGKTITMYGMPLNQPWRNWLASSSSSIEIGISSVQCCEMTQSTSLMSKYYCIPESEDDPDQSHGEITALKLTKFPCSSTG